MAGSSLENFRGNHHEDVYMFLRRVELAAVTINRDEDAYKARMVGLLLEGHGMMMYYQMRSRGIGIIYVNL